MSDASEALKALADKWEAWAEKHSDTPDRLGYNWTIAACYNDCAREIRAALSVQQTADKAPVGWAWLLRDKDRWIIAGTGERSYVEMCAEHDRCERPGATEDDYAIVPISAPLEQPPTLQQPEKVKP